MGAWGYGAFDNDGALDLRDDVMLDISKSSWKKLEKAMGRVNDTGWEGEARAAANMILSIANLGYGKRELKKKLRESEQILQTLLDNEEYIETWREPKKAKTELRKELRKIRKVIDSY